MKFSEIGDEIWYKNKSWKTILKLFFSMKKNRDAKSAIQFFLDIFGKLLFFPFNHFYRKSIFLENFLNKRKTKSSIRYNRVVYMPPNGHLYIATHPVSAENLIWGKILFSSWRKLIFKIFIFEKIGKNRKSWNFWKSKFFKNPSFFLQIFEILENFQIFDFFSDFF